MIKIELADRVKSIPPYLSATIDKMKHAALAKGVDVSTSASAIPIYRHLSI
jgi:hypothetical protein